jgi:hypothetical protein
MFSLTQNSSEYHKVSQRLTICLLLVVVLVVHFLPVVVVLAVY